MKIQIVEYRYDCETLGEKHFRYTLEIDGRAVTWTGFMAEISSCEEIYNKLTRHFSTHCHEYNLDNYPRFSYYDVDTEVLFEQEVSDNYLKEKFVNSRIKKLEEDFK